MRLAHLQCREYVTQAVVNVLTVWFRACKCLPRLYIIDLAGYIPMHDDSLIEMRFWIMSSKTEPFVFLCHPGSGTENSTSLFWAAVIIYMDMFRLLNWITTCLALWRILLRSSFFVLFFLREFVFVCVSSLGWDDDRGRQKYTALANHFSWYHYGGYDTFSRAVRELY